MNPNLMWSLRYSSAALKHLKPHFQTLKLVLSSETPVRFLALVLTCYYDFLRSLLLLPVEHSSLLLMNSTVNQKLLVIFDTAFLYIRQGEHSFPFS